MILGVAQDKILHLNSLGQSKNQLVFNLFLFFVPQEAGATPAIELAFTIADGLEYIRSDDAVMTGRGCYVTLCNGPCCSWVQGLRLQPAL